MTKTEIQSLDWSGCDFILVTGDAYVDHPSYGAAIIARLVESLGYKVGIIAQPDWRTDSDWLELSAPRLGFGVTAGNMDSLVNHYTAQRKLRHNDAYSPDNRHGLRPDRATIIYCNKIRQIYKNAPIIIGGVEASLRRIAHYDFWQDKVRNSILADAKADILVYGMGERQIAEILARLDNGNSIKEIKDIPGTVVFDEPASLEPGKDNHNPTGILPDADTCAEKQTFYQMNRQFFALQQTHILYQKTSGRYIRHNPPAEPLSEEALDKVYSLPFTRIPHPVYEGKIIPAYVQIKDSITTHRGCMGGCNFCAIGLHQGRAIQSRTEASIISEINNLLTQKNFRGTISDLGGPSANMYGMTCKRGYPTSCKRTSCLYPNICQQLITSHKHLIQLLQTCRNIKGVRHIFVSSGIRIDLALVEPDYIKHIAAYHTGGKLKVAPEHTEPQVLQAMSKPAIKLYLDFCELFMTASKQAGKPNLVVPYIIVGHPGTKTDDAIRMHNWLKERQIHLEQVQEFTPTPMTISTCMYYTGLDFHTELPIHVPKGKEIRIQKDLALWDIHNNKKLKSIRRNNR